MTWVTPRNLFNSFWIHNLTKFYFDLEQLNLVILRRSTSLCRLYASTLHYTLLGVREDLCNEMYLGT